VADTAGSAEAERIRAAYARRRDGGRYGWDRPAHLWTMQDLERRILDALGAHGCLPLAGRRILEIGCGSGHFLRELVKWGADPGRLAGIDLLESRLEEARRSLPSGVRLEARNALSTGYADGAFDLILQMTVFTSILSPDLRRGVAGEILRLLAPGGRVLWYDFRIDNPGNPDVRRVGKAEVRSLFPGCAIDFRTVTLAPPLTRALAGWARPLCSLLNGVPALRTHYLAMIAPA
jgi:SAM-dependent methyltransferase